MANIAQTVNVLQAVLLTDGEHLVLTPTYHVFEMNKDHQDAAALQVHLATEAALAELAAFRGQETVGRRLDELEGYRDALARAANESLQGGPSGATIATVTEALEKLESTLRARTASATY